MATIIPVSEILHSSGKNKQTLFLSSSRITMYSTLTCCPVASSHTPHRMGCSGALPRLQLAPPLGAVLPPASPLGPSTVAFVAEARHPCRHRSCSSSRTRLCLPLSRRRRLGLSWLRCEPTTCLGICGRLCYNFTDYYKGGLFVGLGSRLFGV